MPGASSSSPAFFPPSPCLLHAFSLPSLSVFSSPSSSSFSPCFFPCPRPVCLCSSRPGYYSPFCAHPVFFFSRLLPAFSCLLLSPCLLYLLRVRSLFANSEFLAFIAQWPELRHIVSPPLSQPWTRSHLKTGGLDTPGLRPGLRLRGGKVSRFREGETEAMPDRNPSGPSVTCSIITA